MRGGPGPARALRRGPAGRRLRERSGPSAGACGVSAALQLTFGASLGRFPGARRRLPAPVTEGDAGPAGRAPRAAAVRSAGGRPGAFGLGAGPLPRALERLPGVGNASGGAAGEALPALGAVPGLLSCRV